MLQTDKCILIFDNINYEYEANLVFRTSGITIKLSSYLVLSITCKNPLKH